MIQLFNRYGDRNLTDYISWFIKDRLIQIVYLLLFLLYYLYRICLILSLLNYLNQNHLQ